MATGGSVLSRNLPLLSRKPEKESGSDISSRWLFGISRCDRSLIRYLLTMVTNVLIIRAQRHA
jgi:hypothetical protein